MDELKSHHNLSITEDYSTKTRSTLANMLTMFLESLKLAYTITRVIEARK